MYDAIAIAFIVVVAGLCWLTLKWATATGRIGRVGMLRLTIVIFSVIFAERLVETISDPFPKETLNLSLQWCTLVGSLIIVVVSGFRLGRAR